MVLQHILANFRQPGSYSLALQWLYSLFVAYSQADISAQHEAAASAHVNAPQVSTHHLYAYGCQMQSGFRRRSYKSLVAASEVASGMTS